MFVNRNYVQGLYWYHDLICEIRQIISTLIVLMKNNHCHQWLYAYYLLSIPRITKLTYFDTIIHITFIPTIGIGFIRIALMSIAFIAISMILYFIHPLPNRFINVGYGLYINNSRLLDNWVIVSYIVFMTIACVNQLLCLYRVVI